MIEVNMNLFYRTVDSSSLVYLLPCVISAFGTGRCLSNASLFGLAPGLHFLLGLYSIPVFLFFFNSACGLNLFLSSYLVLFIGISGAVLALRDGSKSGASVSHPLWLTLALVSTIAGLGVLSGYSAMNWDEFTHWMLMPKQVFRFGTALSQQFPDKLLLEYPPGWALAITYPFFLQGAGSYQEGVMPLFFLLGCVAVLAATYDVVSLCSDRRSRIWSIAAVSACLLLLVPSRPIEGTLLSETMLNQLVAGSLLLLVVASEGALSLRRTAVWIALLSTAGVLAKASFLASSVSLTLGFGMLCWALRSPSPHEKRRAVFWTALTLALPLAALSIWRSLGHSIGLERFFHYDRAVDLSNPEQAAFLVSLTSTLGRILLEAAPVKTTVIFVACCVAFRTIRLRPIVWAIGSQFVLFFVCCFVVYVKAFGPHNWNSAPSFARYATQAYVGTTVPAIAVLAIRMGQRFPFPYPSPAIAISGTLALFALGSFRSRSALSEFSIKAEHPVVTEALQLQAHIDTSRRERVRLLFVDQQQTLAVWGPVRYGLMRSQGTLIDRFPADYFGPIVLKAGRGTRAVTRDSFAEILVQMDYVWVFKTDAFLDHLLGPYAAGGKGPGWYEKTSTNPLLFSRLPRPDSQTPDPRTLTSRSQTPRPPTRPAIGCVSP
jgi:hypothetical protein